MTGTQVQDRLTAAIAKVCSRATADTLVTVAIADYWLEVGYPDGAEVSPPGAPAARTMAAVCRMHASRLAGVVEAIRYDSPERRRYEAPLRAYRRIAAEWDLIATELEGAALCAT